MDGDFRVERWLVQPSLNSISLDGTQVHIEPKAMEVLVCLVEHAGETLPKETLIHSVWAETFVGDDVLKRCISQLRHAFEDDAREPHIIQTIPKRGYRFIGKGGAEIGWEETRTCSQRSYPAEDRSGHKRTMSANKEATSGAEPIRRLEVPVRAFAIAVVSAVLAVTAAILSQQVLRGILPQWANNFSSAIFVVGLLSFTLTSLALLVAGWRALRSSVDHDTRVTLMCFLIAQVATAVTLAVALIMSGGRLLH
jgi:DNA-binding winged helix-turn-helix (wHTH) protein